MILPYSYKVLFTVDNKYKYALSKALVKLIVINALYNMDRNKSFKKMITQAIYVLALCHIVTKK